MSDDEKFFSIPPLFCTRQPHHSLFDALTSILTQTIDLTLLKKLFHFMLTADCLPRNHDRCDTENQIIEYVDILIYGRMAQMKMEKKEKK